MNSFIKSSPLPGVIVICILHIILKVLMLIQRHYKTNNPQTGNWISPLVYIIMSYLNIHWTVGILLLIKELDPLG